MTFCVVPEHNDAIDNKSPSLKLTVFVVSDFIVVDELLNVTVTEVDIPFFLIVNVLDPTFKPVVADLFKNMYNFDNVPEKGIMY